MVPDQSLFSSSKFAVYFYILGGNIVSWYKIEKVQKGRTVKSHSCLLVTLFPFPLNIATATSSLYPFRIFYSYKIL